MAWTRKHQRGADQARERLDPLAERLALIREGELRAMRRERLGDAPGDRVVIRDPHDQSALALHQTLHESHHTFRFTWSRSRSPITHPPA
jgi:hypothetical protein